VRNKNRDFEFKPSRQPIVVGVRALGALVIMSATEKKEAKQKPSTDIAGFASQLHIHLLLI
jgi:hypothetical protein